MLRPWQVHFRIDEREEKTVFLKLTNLISQEILNGRLGSVENYRELIKLAHN